MSRERDYRQDIKIDVNNLDGEWIEQPSLYLYYSELYADAVAKRDNAKLKVEYTYSKIDSDIRKNLAKYGFSAKPTEPAIKNAVKMDKIYRNSEQVLVKATKEMNIMIGVKASFDQRKSALQSYVSLKISGMNAEPRNLIQDQKYKKKRSKENHTAQKATLKRRKKKNGSK